MSPNLTAAAFLMAASAAAAVLPGATLRAQSEGPDDPTTFYSPTPNPPPPGSFAPPRPPTAALPGATLRAQSEGPDDPTIVAIFDAANTADMETGALAEERGSSKEVRDFGAMLVRDHRAVRQQGRDLAAKLGVTPTPPKDDQSAKDHAAAMARGRVPQGRHRRGAGDAATRDRQRGAEGVGREGGARVPGAHADGAGAGEEGPQRLVTGL